MTELLRGLRTLLDVTSFSEAADVELLAMARSEPEAFGELFKRHSRSVYAYCARRTGNLDLAEDLTSVVFMEAFRRRRKLHLSNASALPWLLGVANNVARNADRSVRRYRSALDRLPALTNSASSEDDAIERLGAQDALARALEAISALTRAEQDVVRSSCGVSSPTPTRQPRSTSRSAPSALVWPVPGQVQRLDHRHEDNHPIHTGDPMNYLQAPPVPNLDDLRLSTRQAHLVREITVHRRHRRRGGLAVGGGALVAGGVATVVLVLGGPGTANAFAAWTSSPTTPAPGQVSSAEATCEAGATAPPPGLPTGTTQVSLVDTRGPFTLVLFGANTSTKGTLMCVSGPSINSSAQANSQMSESIGNQPVLPKAGQIGVDRLQAESANNGQAYTIAEGSVGSGVTAATLVLSDGSDVVTTTGNGLFLAWWPGSAVVTSATVTTATGTTTQPISSPTLDTGGSGNSVKRSIGIG
jgi:RNA polymerase sigma factor (sigma-70 family)